MSEDALSWNVFVALLKACKLRETARYLTGRPIEDEPELYLWGSRPDDAAPFAPLDRVRKLLESDIRRFGTEPDIMLVVPGKLVICIEAKFSSGNGLSSEAATKPGEKPKDVAGLLHRYLEDVGTWPEETRYLTRERIAGTIHSQLFRNVVFAARMAKFVGDGADWHVVNLVSSTQWKNLESSKDYDFKDPSERVRSYLTDGYRDHFTFRDWEGLYSEVVKAAPDLKDLQKYLLGKSAHFVPAFAID